MEDMAKYKEVDVEISGDEEFIIAKGSVKQSVHMARDVKFFKDGVTRCGIRAAGGLGWTRNRNPVTPICRICYDAYLREMQAKSRKLAA